MGSLTLAAITFAVVFVGGAIGLELQRALPESYTTGGPKDMTGAVVGLMTLLLALVLGLLIWTAYGVFSAQKASVQTLAITDLKLDEAFQDYGPEAVEGHRILRDGIKNTIAEIWKSSDDEQAVIHKFGYARANLKARLALLNTLQPASDQQTAAKAEATQAAIAIDQTLAQMTLALVDPISYSLIGIVVAWAAFLFCGYGLLSKRHPMSYVVLVIGAMGVASAIYPHRRFDRFPFSVRRQPCAERRCAECRREPARRRATPSLAQGFIVCRRRGGGLPPSSSHGLDPFHDPACARRRGGPDAEQIERARIEPDAARGADG